MVRLGYAIINTTFRNGWGAVTVEGIVVVLPILNNLNTTRFNRD